MIPKAYITEWSKSAPWQQNFQIEQDLLIERIIIELYQDEFLRNNLAFRGGTAMHKLFLRPQARYSEDIDLVQIKPGEIGDILSRIRTRLTFMGEANYFHSGHNNTLKFKYMSEFENLQLKIKIEVNTREHFSSHGFINVPYNTNGSYFSGESSITTYRPEELLATKLRALYQRKKGRDLFDIWYALQILPIDTIKVIEAFKIYMEQSQTNVTAKQFILNMETKMKSRQFQGDLIGLLRNTVSYEPESAWEIVKTELVDKI